MPRSNLKRAREKKNLTQTELAERIGSERKAVARWEAGSQEPSAHYRRKLEEILGDEDGHLFDIDHVESDQISQPCHTGTTRDILESSDHHPIIYIPWSVRGFSEFMEMLRRQFIDASAKIFGASLFGNNVSLAIVSSPTVDPEEYLDIVETSIGTWWGWLSQGHFHELERVLLKHVPVLTRLAITISPFQRQAASLAVEAKIMQIRMATGELQFAKRVIYCGDAVRFGALSGDRNLHATALYWYGDTFTYCYHQPQTAINHSDNALSVLKSESPLIRSKICSNLSIAYAQKGDEIEAMNYAEMARASMPEHPELDPSYRYGRHGHSELDQFEGRTRLFLADSLPSRSYARQAYDILEKSTNQQARDQRMRGQALIRKADADRTLGDMNGFVKDLTEGLLIPIGQDRLAYAQDIMNRVPPKWKQEKSVQDLQKDISRAIVIARR